jgi:AAA domain
MSGKLFEIETDEERVERWEKEYPAQQEKHTHTRRHAREANPRADIPPAESANDFGFEEPRAKANGGSSDGPIDLGERDAGDDAEQPSPRGWLEGNIFCRKFLSSLLGDGGVGKTAVRYAQYLSLAVNRSLTGEHIFQRARVLIISLEDDIEELQRRILAAIIHHRIDRADLKGWLFYAAPGAAAGKLMTIDRTGRALRGQLAASIEAAIVKHGIDLVAIDPFVKSHAVPENENSIIDEVTQVLTDLAAKHNIAIDSPHHISKGPAEPGNANRGRGASAMVNAGRLVFTLTTMNNEEANAFGIAETERRQYVRVDSGKVNITKGGGAVKWFHLVGVRLDNGTDLYPNGDEVQTVEPWKPPETWSDLSIDLLNQVLTRIDTGLPDGNRFTDAPSGKERAAWKVILEFAPNKSEAQAREIIKTWVKNGVLA